jgi:glycolate oxidase FAD binding subunit
MDITLLHKVLSPEMVVTDAAVLTGFAVDGILPKAVIYPTSLSQAAEAMKLANAEKWAVVPWGGGTKMRLGRVPARVDLVLSTSRMDKVIDIDVANLTVTAQAGVKLGDLQDLLGGTENRCFFPLATDLKEQGDYMCSSRDYKGAFLPLDPPSSDRATLGGIIASNSTGPKRLRYGLPRDLVLGIRYVAPTGEIIGMGGKTVKNVSGYDVSKIMIGSLGTLGILGDMTFRLLPLPEQAATVLASFATLAGAKAFSDGILNSKLLPTSLEILNGPGFALSGLSDMKVPSGSWCVAIGLEGFNEEVQREISDMNDMAKLDKASEVITLDRSKAATFWENLGNCIPAGAEKTAVKFKGSFLISHYAEIMEAWAAASNGINCAFTCSAGLGLAYAYVIGNPVIEIEKVAKLGEAFRTATEKYGGSMVAEDAPLALKQKLDPWGPTRGDFILMKRIKENLDPFGVLNPGRFLGGL